MFYHKIKHLEVGEISSAIVMSYFQLQFSRLTGIMVSLTLNNISFTSPLFSLVIFNNTEFVNYLNIQQHIIIIILL